MNQAQPPTGLRPPPHTTGNNSNADDGSQRRFIFLILGLLMVLALIVVFLLPAQLNKQSDAKQASPPALERITLDTRPPSPPPATLQKTPKPLAQKNAQIALQTFLRLRAHATFNNAENWAEAKWQGALTQADEGDELYGKGEFKAAQTSYEAATLQLTELQNQRPEILSDTLEMARLQLQNDQAELAIASFEKALMMQENHPQAQTGLTQAKAREPVLQKMQLGHQALADDQLQLAKTAFEATLALDPTYTPAGIALKTLQNTLDQQAYQSAMSNALTSLQSGKFAAARKALDAAAKISPDSAEINDARQALKLAIKQAKLNRLRRESGEMAATEQWGEAAALYRQALSIEPQAGFALSGQSRAQARLELHGQLDHYLDKPQRLYSDEPLKNAQVLLKANTSEPQNEPQLLAKLISLKKLLADATNPVSLVIESDELTQISIYHVGQLGQFQRKQLSLRPGRYTLVGSRAGYRDVRKVIDLRPNAPAQLQLKCEEAI